MPPPQSSAGKHREALLALREVRSWFKDHASPATAQTQLEQLELFTRRTGLDPPQLIQLATRQPRKLQDLVQEYVRGQQEKGRSSRYALNVWWGVRSFLAHGGLAPQWVPKLKPVASDEHDGAETIPTAEQLRAILNALPTRGRAAALLMATSGIRVGVLATQHGPADGLRLKHLPELVLDPEPRIGVVPFQVRVPAHLAKGSTVARPRGYLTFGTGESAEAIVSYLKARQAGGERLGPMSALIAPDGRGRKSDRTSADGVRFMARKALAFSLRAAMERVKPEGVHWHAHTLRAWFSTQMEAAEARGWVSRSRREFFMGHSGGVDFDYNLNRPKSDAKIAELRATYQKCEPLLSIQPLRPGGMGMAEMARVMLLGLGYTEEELARQDFENLDPAVFQELVSRKVTPTPAQRKQEVVDASQLPRRLAQGWTVAVALSDQQIVLNSPGS